MTACWNAKTIRRSADGIGSRDFLAPLTNCGSATADLGDRTLYDAPHPLYDRTDCMLGQNTGIICDSFLQASYAAAYSTVTARGSITIQRHSARKSGVAGHAMT